MLGALNDFCGESDIRAGSLPARMAEFYRSTPDYDAFKEPTSRPEFWDPVVSAIARIANRGETCRVLEFGAGRTGFGRYLGPLRKQVRFDVQDITDRNRGYLASEADNVHIGDIFALEGPYDVIFSTFAWEHVSRPRAILDHLLRMLTPLGVLFLASPRYDFPGYLSPSAKRYSRMARGGIAVWLVWRRLRSLVSGHSAFLLHVEPAALHGTWFRDADAIHWVSLLDLQAGLEKQWDIRRIRIPAFGLAGRFWEKFLLMFVAIQRSESGRADKIPEAERST